MKKSIQNELIEYGVQRLAELQLSNSEIQDVHEVHHQLFNSDYYIIGYYEADQWLKEHEINVFAGIEFCKNNEEEHFGEFFTNIDNSEILVNHIVYWVGMEVIEEIIYQYKNS